MIRTASDQVPALDDLLRNAAWARRLARSLVSDDASADDLVQDAWLSALRRPPDTSEPVRPWLRTVLRHQLFNRVRGDRRRATREEAASATNEASSPEELVARVEIQKILVDAVLALKEPYRQTVLLRYFEGLSAAEIAARTNVPPATVRGRLKVALDLLREALAAREQGRFDWARAIRKLGDAATEAVARPRGPAATHGLPAKLIFVGVLIVVAVPAVRWLVDRHTRDVRQSEEESTPGSTARPIDGVRIAREGADQAVRAFRVGTKSASDISIAAPATDSSPLAMPTGVVGVARTAARARPPVVVTDDSGNLANVAIKVVKGLATAPAPTFGPADTIVFRLSPVGFIPRLGMARVGQPIAVANADFRAHDLTAQQDEKVLFEGAASPGTEPRVVMTAPSGQAVRIGAGAEARAFVVTTDEPFGAVSDRHGRFSLPGLPPGHYTLEAWHEYFGASRSEVTVPASGVASVAFTFEDPSPALPSAPSTGACRIALTLQNPVVRACRKGGRPVAKKVMKQLVAAGQLKGHRTACEGCHQDLDDYTLVEGAEAKLVDLLRLVDEKRAP